MLFDVLVVEMGGFVLVGDVVSVVDWVGFLLCIVVCFGCVDVFVVCVGGYGIGCVDEIDDV